TRGRLRTRGRGRPRRAGASPPRARRRRRGQGSCRAAGARVIPDEAFIYEPWAVREKSPELEHLAQAESIFALSNGHIGWRANLDEGEPHVTSGTYLNGLFESVPLPYAEAAYGNPEAGQTIVNATNRKIIRLLVDDEPLDVRYG